MTHHVLLSSVVLGLIAAHPVTAQTTDTVSVAPTVRDPQALAVANKALQALAPATALTDITLQGTASRTAGSDYQSGTFTFEGSGNGKSLITLNLDGGQRQDVRNGPAGYWVGPDSQEYPMATHNCWTDAPWFYPGLSLQGLASDAQVSILYGGLETRDGVALYHLRLFRTVPGLTPTITSDIQRLSTVDLYLDATTYFPLVLTFQTHPDDDLNLNIPVEVQFGDYRLVNGVRVPFRIQKLLQGSLLLDITVSGATVNSGLPDSLFAVPLQ